MKKERVKLESNEEVYEALIRGERVYPTEWAENLLRAVDEAGHETELTTCALSWLYANAVFSVERVVSQDVLVLLASWTSSPDRMVTHTLNRDYSISMQEQAERYIERLNGELNEGGEDLITLHGFSTVTVRADYE